MAYAATLRLKTDIDNTAAQELAPRLKTAIHDALAAARTAGADEAGAAAYAVMVEILRVRQATPAETAIDRVRQLHRQEYGSCTECTHEFSVAWPCPTIRALDDSARTTANNPTISTDEGTDHHGGPLVPAVITEAIRQMDADPYGLKAGMIVQSYRERGQEKWVFRCWGTDDGCEGLFSLDHSSQQGAERARDRHVAEDHQPKEG